MVSNLIKSCPVSLVIAAGAAKSLQLCPTLCDPIDYIARQTLLFMGFSRQEYWSGILEWLPFPPEDLPNPGIKPEFPALQAISLLTEPPGKPSKPNKLLLKNAVIL